MVMKASNTCESAGTETIGDAAREVAARPMSRSWAMAFFRISASVMMALIFPASSFRKSEPELLLAIFFAAAYNVASCGQVTILGLKMDEMGWLKNGRLNSLSFICLATMPAYALFSISLPKAFVK